MIKTLDEVVNEIINLGSKEEILNYCKNDNLPDKYFREGYSTYDYENGRSIFSLISGDSSYNDIDYEGDDYIQIQCWKHHYIIGINLVDNKLFTYDYQEWDDGDCSEIIELDEYELKF